MFSTQVSVEAAHFGARVLKRKPPGDEGMPNRTGIWLFEGVNVDEIGKRGTKPGTSEIHEEVAAGMTTSGRSLFGAASLVGFEFLEDSEDLRHVCFER